MHTGELQWFVDATDYPTQSMTNYTLPSPLVVTYSNDNSSDRAWQVYNNVLSSLGWQGDAGVVTGWVQLDLGLGNGINPTSCTVTATSPPGDAATRSPKDFTFEGSETGSWAGEEVVFYTATGETSWGPSEARNYVF